MNQQFIPPQPQISSKNVLNKVEQMGQYASLIKVQNQKLFVVLLMIVSMIQAALQLGIAFISINSNIKAMKLSFTIPMFIFTLALQITILLFIKSYSHFWNTQLKEILITILYSLISTTSVSIFAVRLVYNSILISALFLFLFCNLFAYLFITITFLCYKEPTIKQTLVSSMTGVLIFFIIYVTLLLQGFTNNIDGKFWFVIVMIFVYVLFLAFATSQILSLFQLMNGKFKLTERNFFIATLLLFYNTLLPFLD